MDASQKIDEYIAKTGGWRGERLAQIRQVIQKTLPDVIEEWKWNSPIWSQHGMICSSSAFKAHVKINFFKGASLDDAGGFFNAGLDAKDMRSRDLKEGDTLDEAALADMLQRAAEFNREE